MNEQEQAIAIHEARGLCPHTEREYYTCQGDSGFTCKKCGDDISGWRLPFYPHDLNAMREATMTLNGEQCETFTRWLIRIIGPQVFNQFLWINATAAQRAEAFLRTIGKWKDELNQTNSTPKQ